MACIPTVVQIALWLLLIVCIATDASLASSSNSNRSEENKVQSPCNEREREALLKFKHVLNASYDILTSWVGDDCCSWMGVRCNYKTGHVTMLLLRREIYVADGDYGEIHPSLLELQHLMYLDLSYNNFGYKPIPKFLGSFMKLRHLDLSHTDFVGSIPHQLGNISSLHYLDLNQDYSPYLLSVDNLQWLSHLSSLQYLDMGGVNLSMAADWLQAINMIPSLSELHLSRCGLRNFPTLSHLNLTSLTVLDLSINSIASNSIDWLSNLRSNLVSLDLSHNKFEGLFPSSLWGAGVHLKKHGRFAPLRKLDVSYNNFSGTVSKSLGQLTNLVHLEISHNSFEGVVSEAHFANLTRLESLYMSENSFVFNVSPHWIPPSQLKCIGLRSCKVGPQFPTWLQFMKRDNLELDLSRSQITDVMPDWFWNISSQVTYVNMSQNQIYGKIPSSLCFQHYARIDFSSNLLEGYLPQNVSDVLFLDLSNNSFSGPINMSTSNVVQYLSLSNNNLEGSIPFAMCGIEYLFVLDLSNNYLTGQIPSCLRNSTSLFVLDLSYNNLYGVIPNFLYALFWLQLSHNNLSGLLPSSIRGQSILCCLDLSENRLFGPIPSWIGESLMELAILNLRSNMFYGSIPPQLSLLSSLQILDLSNNRLSGNIPSSFYNFTSMTMAMSRRRPYSGFSIFDYNFTDYGKYVIVVMKRTVMKYTKTLSLVAIIDLSRNNLSGEIPQALTNLDRLQSLNLSGNHLEGKIPQNIGSLHQLQSLDLSQNRLSGTIPSSISSLTFLSSLNLSNNNLSGRIPSGNQLQTLIDPSIYSGNYDLCGRPLPKLCPGEEYSQAPNTVRDEDENDGSEQWWFFVGVAPGFVVGFWLVCGILIFSKSWRIAYYRFFDRLNEKLSGFYVYILVKAMMNLKGLAAFL